MNLPEPTQGVFHFDNDRPNFEHFAIENGIRYWTAQWLMECLGYTSFVSFKKAIMKAMTACATLSIEIDQNFRQTKTLCDGKETLDYELSRFACYMIVMNADPKKPQVAKAQAFFATQVEAFRRFVSEAEDVERVAIREEVAEHQTSLSGIAHAAGVENFAFFQNAGYRGMYNMNINGLKNYKGLKKGTLLDFMGKQEIAANLFRVTQTEAKIENESIKGQKALEQTAYTVGSQVRKAMHEISGTKPEDLPLAQDIKKVRTALKTTHKGFIEMDRKRDSS